MIAEGYASGGDSRGGVSSPPPVTPSPFLSDIKGDIKASSDKWQQRKIGVAKPSVSSPPARVQDADLAGMSVRDLKGIIEDAGMSYKARHARHPLRSCVLLTCRCARTARKRAI